MKFLGLEIRWAGKTEIPGDCTADADISIMIQITQGILTQLHSMRLQTLHLEASQNASKSFSVTEAALSLLGQPLRK